MKKSVLALTAAAVTGAAVFVSTRIPAPNVTLPDRHRISWQDSDPGVTFNVYQCTNLAEGFHFYRNVATTNCEAETPLGIALYQVRAVDTNGVESDPATVTGRL